MIFIQKAKQRSVLEWVILQSLRALLSPQSFFQGNFNIYFEYYFSICCLFNIYYQSWLTVGGKSTAMVFSTALKFCGVYVTNSGLLTDVLRWFCPLSSRVPAQLCAGAVGSPAEAESSGSSSITIILTHVQNGPLLEAMGRSHNPMTQVTIIPLHLQNLSFHSLEGLSSSTFPPSLISLPAK